MAAAQLHTSPPGGSHRLSATCTGGSWSIPLCSVHTCVPGASSIRGDQCVIWHRKRSQCTIVLHGESSKTPGTAEEHKSHCTIVHQANATVHIYRCSSSWLVRCCFCSCMCHVFVCRSCSLRKTANYVMLRPTAGTAFTHTARGCLGWFQLFMKLLCFCLLCAALCQASVARQHLQVCAKQGLCDNLNLASKTPLQVRNNL